MASLRRVATVTTVALAVAVVMTASSGAHPPKPTSPNAALADGCQRSDLGIGFDTSPVWVYVYRSPTIRTARGVVHISHGSLEDSILQHRSYDYNGNLVPDKPFQYLIAGNPSTGTNNYASDEGEARGRLHFEWESATLPFFAWPTDGDRATLWASWIWDCGHWQSTANNTGGTTTGEHSELHPLNAIVVNRRPPTSPRAARARPTRSFQTRATGHTPSSSARSLTTPSAAAPSPSTTPASGHARRRFQTGFSRSSRSTPSSSRPHASPRRARSSITG